MQIVKSVLRPLGRWLPPGGLAGCLAVLLSVGGPVRADRLPLPPGMQAVVNGAIDRGVLALRAGQFPDGSWAAPNKGHRVGYAALPALTLLECGVPPNDPAVQRAAVFVRHHSLKLDTTYELSLSILFLDQLGDTRDRNVIRMMALRLVAGQTATGGWSYKCPVLNQRHNMDLLTALKHLTPKKPPLEGIARRPGAGPRPPLEGVARKPGEKGEGLGPGITRKPGDKRDDLGPGLTRRPGERSLDPLGPAERRSPLEGSTTGSSSTGSPREGSVSPFPSEDRNPAPKPAPENKPPAAPEVGDRNKEAEAGKPDAPVRPEKPYSVPRYLQVLPVLQDPRIHNPLVDRPGGEQKPWGRTDNSNSQFAILGLWVAQRYDIPMDRTMKLVMRRYETSQKQDGTWDYLYPQGGHFSPPMTAVGLIGLAVGHGMAHPGSARMQDDLAEDKPRVGKSGRQAKPSAQPVKGEVKPRRGAEPGEGKPNHQADLGEGKELDPGPRPEPVNDPHIPQGLLALGRFIGQPTGKWANLPMQNLYFLWSVERVGVLYDLPMIDNKDWYRWGAEILVANQQPAGYWTGGGYPGAAPPLDTSLALLFLKRANLARGLDKKLPFKREELAEKVNKKIPAEPPPPPAPTPEPVTKTVVQEAQPSETVPQTIDKSLLGADEASAAPPPSEPPSERGSLRWVVLLLVAIALLLGGGGVFLILQHTRKANEEDEDEDDHRPRRPPRRRPRR